jgi:hypothetical protein
MAMPAGIWTVPAPPNLPALVMLPSGFTAKELMLLLDWLLWKSRVLSGLYWTTFELVPLLL